MTLQRLLDTFLQDRTAPGFVLLAGNPQRIVFQRAYGQMGWLPQPAPASEDAIYDLASLTKPLATALLCAWAAQRKALDLQAPIQRYLPQWPGAGTITQLLTHSAGLRDWHPLYLYDVPYLETLQRLPLVYRPGKKVLYSCLGYLLLQEILERQLGADLATLVGRHLIQPLGLQATFAGGFQAPRERVAPTENGQVYERELARRHLPERVDGFAWRRELIWGATHDGNAHYRGALGGNAGLFANAHDVWRLACEFLPECSTLLHPDMARLFLLNLTPRRRAARSLGFKLNCSWHSARGRSLERAAIGHSGSTGTSLYIEPQAGRIYVILSNRVHPHVTPLAFDRVRRRLHAALRRECF